MLVFRRFLQNVMKTGSALFCSIVASILFFGPTETRAFANVWDGFSQAGFFLRVHASREIAEVEQNKELDTETFKKFLLTLPYKIL